MENGKETVVNKYPDYIMAKLRQRRGKAAQDTSLDEHINSYRSDTAFREVLVWDGLLGGWDSTIKGYIKVIYGIDLDAAVPAQKQKALTQDDIDFIEFLVGEHGSLSEEGYGSLWTDSPESDDERGTALLEKLS